MHRDSPATRSTDGSRRRFLKAVGVGGIGVTVAGCVSLEDGNGDDGSGGDNGTDDTGGDEAEQSGSLTIGMVDSVSGTLSPYGERNQRGKDLALTDVNAVGIGSAESDLEVIVEDSESSEGPGVSSAEKLVNQDDVPIVVGAVSSGVSTAIYDSVIEGSDVVQISQNSTSPRLSDRPDLLRMSPSGRDKGSALAKLLDDDGIGSVAVTFVNNDYGQGLSEVFEGEFPGDVAYNQPHDQGEASYGGVISDMDDADVEAWLFITYAEEFTVMVNEAYERGLTEEYELYGAESTIAEDILENTPEGSHDGMTGITESAPVEQDNYVSFKGRFDDEYGQAPTVWSAYAYDAMVVSALALHLADGGDVTLDLVRDLTRPDGETVLTYEAAVDAVEPGGDPSAVDYQGVSGPIDLDDNGDPRGFYQVYTVRDHSYEFGDFVTS
jgi:branched-chain amino acid transport system substrate-binding protein